MSRWHLITGTYLPSHTGLAANSWQIASGLVRAGDLVEVWTPAGDEPASSENGVIVHRLPDHFGLRSLRQLGPVLRTARNDRVLVQYTPHAYGRKAMNWPFCRRLARLNHPDLTVIFHEVVFPRIVGQPLRHRLLYRVTSAMAATMARAATRVMVTIPAWEPILRALVPGIGQIDCFPICSNIAPLDDPPAVAAIRARLGDGLVVGHFGTYDSLITALLFPPLARLLEQRACRLLLLGVGGERARNSLIDRWPVLADRVHASGDLSERELSLHLQACDLMFQPYPDGVSGRRSTLMAALNHGLPVVSTIGHLTEPWWIDSGALALAPVAEPARLAAMLERVAEDCAWRHHLAAAGRALYEDRFALRHGIAALRAAN